MMAETEENPRYWPPLGLPVGSVRAILTLFIVAVVTLSAAKGRKLEFVWTETLLIALAHYFTSRRFVALPPQAIARLQQEGILEQEQHPLYLPRHSIRLLILAAFMALGVFLYRKGPPYDTEALSLLGIVAAYVLGAIVRGIGSWFGRRTGRRPASLWGDLKAIVVLLAVAIAGVPELLAMPEALPPLAHKIALALMLFYFGSR
jgi:cytochrome bd-type quinol oxidase subunit 1